MKKRIIAWLLAGLLAVSLAGCSGEVEETAGSTAGSEAAEATEASSKPETEPETESKPEETPEFQTSAIIEETVLYQEQDIRITAEALTYTAHSVDLQLVLENQGSQPRRLLSHTESYGGSAVNGYMIDVDTPLDVELAPESQEDAVLSFPVEELMRYGIRQVAVLQLGFQIWEEDGAAFETGPAEIRTSAYGHFDADADPYQAALEQGAFAEGSQIVYMDTTERFGQQDVHMVSAAVVSQENSGPRLLLEVANRSEETARGQVAGLSLNGLGIFYGSGTVDNIHPGATRIVEIPLQLGMSGETMEAYGISEISRIAFDFALIDRDGQALGEPEAITLAVSEPETAFDASGQEVYSGDGVQILSKGLQADSNGDATLLFLIQNQGEEELQVGYQEGSLSLNGTDTQASSQAAAALPAGGTSVFYVQVASADRDASGILEPADIRTAKLTFEIQDAAGSVLAEPEAEISYQP